VFMPALVAAISLDVDLPEREVTQGASVTGAVLAEAGSDLTVAGCEVALVRTTSYVYRQGNIYGGAMSVPTRATEVVAARGLRCAGPLRSGGLLTLPFTLDIPTEGPGTVSASLIQVQWAVRIRMHAIGSPPKESLHPIVVLSGATDSDSAAHRPPVIVDRGLVALRFDSLGSRRLAPGAIIRGMLALDSLRPGAARGARVELVLREEVHRGPWIGTDPTRNPANESRQFDTVVARQVVAHRIELDPGIAVALPFLLSAPGRLAAPSLATDRFSVSWILRGVVDRALRPDPYVEIELHGATAPR
jgi:hypothetical protein